MVDNDDHAVGDVLGEAVIDYRTWYNTKRREDNRERQRRCRARKAQAAMAVDAEVALASDGDSIQLPKGVYLRYAQKTSARLARDIALFAATKLKDYDTDIQGLSVQKFLAQPVVSGIVPSYLENPRVAKLNEHVVGNLREGIQSHLAGTQKSNVVMAKDIVCAFSAGMSTSRRGLATVLGVDIRCVRKGFQRRVSLDTTQNAFWLHYRHATRSDAMSKEATEVVLNWWTNGTTVSLNMKDIVRHRTGVKEYDTHPAHYLQTSQLEFYTAFKVANPSSPGSLTKFQMLKPWWVKRLNEWNTCCCRYHQELSFLREGLNDMRDIARGGVHHHYVCNCMEICAHRVDPGRSTTSCNAGNEKYERLKDLYRSVLCPKEEFGSWHDRACLLGECENCGVHMLNICPHEMDCEALVKWRRIGYEVTGHTESSKEKKTPRIEYLETKPSELFEYVKPKIKEFIEHNYFATWQDNQFKELMCFIPNDTVISCIDFSENYSLKVQNEIQSMHWYNFQITILVHITYRINPLWNYENDETLIKKEVHYYISDEGQHDSLLVQHAFCLHWKFLRGKEALPKNHVVFSDGCSGQFKSARAWYFVSRYPSLTTCAELPEGCQMIWNFFGTGHGNGEVDGAGALVKRNIRKEQMKPNGKKLQNANEIVQFLREEAQKEQLDLQMHGGVPTISFGR